MPLTTSRIPFDSHRPYRAKRPATDKIIFLSLEGSVTEEEYFELISEIFNAVKTKIQFVSVAEDAVHTTFQYRTTDQKKLLSKVRPKQLVERINQFKKEKENIYEFTQHPEDEFWIVVDIDQNLSDIVINPEENKTYLDEWQDTVTMCKENGYRYAVSNPFFEIWLLLHHDNPTEEDKSFAVTDKHPYQKTPHFRDRLTNLGVPLKNKKHINPSNYTIQNVEKAIQRADLLHIDKGNLCPQYFATTVYLILQEIIKMLPPQSLDT